MIRDQIKKMASEILWEFLTSLPWPYIIGGLAVFLIALVFVATILSVMKKYIPAMFITAAVMASLAWYSMPTPAQAPPKAAARATPSKPWQPPDLWKMLPSVDVPALIDLLKLRLAELWDRFPSFRWATSPRKPIDNSEELGRRKLEEERRRRAMLANQKRMLKKRNEMILGEIDRMIWNDVAAIEAENERIRAMQSRPTPVPPIQIKPPIVIPRRK